MVMIFVFSSFRRDESASQSEMFTEVIVKLLYPQSSGWDEAKRETVYATTGSAVRKLAHFGEFMLLGAALMLHFDAINKARPLRYGPAAAFTVGAAYAVSDEFHQLFVEGRGGTPTDVLIDTAGVAAGVCVLMLVLWLAARSAEKRSKKDEDAD
jgi:VanZ family protein